VWDSCLRQPLQQILVLPEGHELISSRRHASTLLACLVALGKGNESLEVGVC
jgi:hypothetical protein